MMGPFLEICMTGNARVFWRHRFHSIWGFNESIAITIALDGVAKNTMIEMSSLLTINIIVGPQVKISRTCLGHG